MLFALYRMGYHGCATVQASTALNEMGFRPDVVERQLAHEERNRVRAAYNRAEYLGERRAMMNRWADYLDGHAGDNCLNEKRLPQRNQEYLMAGHQPLALRVRAKFFRPCG